MIVLLPARVVLLPLVVLVAGLPGRARRASGCARWAPTATAGAAVALHCAPRCADGAQRRAGAAGLSQERFARLAGCAPKTTWWLEHDPQLRPHMRIRRRLAAPLDLPLDAVEAAPRPQRRAG